MSDESKPARYHAYLLRFWHEGDGSWRGTVEDPHSGKRQAFADVDKLFAYVRHQIQPKTPVNNKQHSKR